ncbi:hypothetical protein QZH46_27930 [Pseudomonas corrugata]
MNNSHENLLVIVLAALVVIILCSQVAGKIAQRFGQPLAVGEITGGIVLGALLGDCGRRAARICMPTPDRY